MKQRDAFQQKARQEFGDGTSEPPSGASRRQFLQLMGAAMAMAGLAVAQFSGLPAAAALPVGIMIGLGGPHLLVGRLIARRRKKFLALFPEAIDLIVRGLKSGLPVTESMKTVATEIREPVGPIFRHVIDDLNMGTAVEQALWHAAARIDVPEFRFLIVSLSVQRETGGNLSETLANLGDILRKRSQTRLKIKALSAEARASALIIGALPFIMFGLLWLVNPDYLMPLFDDFRGNVMLGIGLAWLLVGFVVMTRMVSFEI